MQNSESQLAHVQDHDALNIQCAYHSMRIPDECCGKFHPLWDRQTNSVAMFKDVGGEVGPLGMPHAEN